MFDRMAQESLPGVKVPTPLLLSLGAVPVLAVLLGGRAFVQAMREIGEASEEIFRGDRLPVLEAQDLQKDTEPVSDR